MAIPTLSTPSARPLVVGGELQHLLSVETFDSWGLILLVFESETHIYAANSDSQLHRFVPNDQPMEKLDTETVGQIAGECQKREVDGVNVLEQQLLALTGHRAIAMADLFQRVRVFDRVAKSSANTFASIVPFVSPLQLPRAA